MGVNDSKPKDPKDAGGYGASGSILGGVYASAGGIVGGGKDKSGLDLVEDYANSVYSKAKKELILKLAGAAAVAMQMGKRNFSDIEEAVDFLAKNVPNPKKGEKVKPGAGIHRKVCEALAVEINAAYGTKLISADSNERVCNEVAEVVHSLIRGLHMEFAGVAADVDQVSKNLMILLQYLEQNHMKYNEIISASNDPEIKASSEIVTKFYEKLIDEVKRQLAVLNNIVGNVIGPVGKDLVALVEQSDSFKGMVENIKNELGTKEFGEKLGYVLSGVSDSAQAAKIVEKALAEVGMSVAEYRNTKGVEDLKNKIFEALGRSGKQLGGEEIVKFVKAADVLYRYDFRQPQILEYLKKAGGVDPDSPKPEDDAEVEIKVDGGGCGCEGADGGRPNFGVVGGADGKDAADIFERKTDLKQSLTVKARELDRFREELFNDFEKSLLTHYRNVVGIVAQIGPKLGNEIPIDEHVREFVRNFATMDSTNRTTIARALSGYNKSGASLASRNRFIAEFAKLLTLAAPLASKSSLFKNLENEIKELNNLIEIFGEKFVKAIQSPLNPRVKGPYAKGGEDGGTYGGDVDGGDFVPSNVSTGNAEKYASFKKAKLQLSYYMAIANIKKSMARAATDDIGTDEAYKSMMGQSVALMIKAEAKKMENVDARLKAFAANLGAAITPAQKDLIEKANELAKKQFTARKELLECAQNIDLYLRSFTADAVSKPETLIKLSGVLQQFVNVRKFYTKVAGDNLVNVFESFPKVDALGNQVGQVHEDQKDYISDEMVNKFASNHREQLIPGPIADGDDAKVTKFVKKVDDAVYGIRALENVLLAFAQIGNEQSDKTFMSHGKVLKVLSDYIAASAYSIRGKPAPGVAPAIGLTNHQVRYEDGKGVDSNEYLQNSRNQILNIVLNQLDVTDNNGARNDENGAYENDFVETNKVFVYILKAICGKILTVLGLYSIYNMPNSDYMSISAVRTILGGGADKPTIIPEALELYVRLPLLAEWLRTSFVNVDTGSPLAAANGYAIAMIPDTTSPWSEFLKLFLIKTTHVTDGNYSESDVYAIIGEINKIYTAYREKSPEDTAYAAQEGLVKDFNSRYGIMKTAEVKKYMDKYRSQDDYTNDPVTRKDDDFNNFDLLDSKNARSAGPAPSDRYLETTVLSTASGSSWTEYSASLVKALHYNIASKFKANYQRINHGKVEDMVNVTSSIHSVIEQYKYELAAAASNDEKVKVVAKAIQSVGMFSNQNPSKYLMFHEMVVSPLFSLFRLFQTLRQFIGAYAALEEKVDIANGNVVAANNNPVNADVQQRVINAITHAVGDNAAEQFGDINRRKFLRFQLSLLTTIKTALGDLVGISVGGSEGSRYPVVDLGAAKDYAGIVLENVKKALSSLRAFMPASYVKYFEDIGYQGSVFWVQSHMMDQLFGNNETDANEAKLNVKKLNANVKKMFKAAVSIARATNGVGFETAFDLCYWRTSQPNLDGNDVIPVGDKALPFPNNVIELVDDMDPAKGTAEKQTMEKKYNAVFNGYQKAVVGVAERLTANQAATPGQRGLLGRNVPAAANGADIDQLFEMTLESVQGEKNVDEVNFVTLQPKAALIKNLATAYNAANNVFIGASDPNNITLAEFVALNQPLPNVAVSEYNNEIKQIINNVAAVVGFNMSNLSATYDGVVAAIAEVDVRALFALPRVKLDVLKHIAVIGIYHTLAAVPQASRNLLLSYIHARLLVDTATVNASLAAVNLDAVAAPQVGAIDSLLVALFNGAVATFGGAIVLNGPAIAAAPAGVGVVNALVINMGIDEVLNQVRSNVAQYFNADYFRAQYRAYDVDLPLGSAFGAGGIAAPDNHSKYTSALFIIRHWGLKKSYETVKAIISQVKTGNLKKIALQATASDAAYVTEANRIMDEYEKIAKGTENDIDGRNTTLIFNTVAMNEPGSFENKANGHFNTFGIVPMFNRTLQRYMDTFFDKLASKFYSPLIEEFATGHFSPAIVAKKAYSDTNIIGGIAAATSSLGFPKSGVVLASSNARGIRIILNKRDDKGVAKMYALNSLADVSPQMKETMRANLPLFRSAFRDLYDQAEILKKLIFNTEVKNDMKYDAAFARPAMAPHRDQSAEPYGPLPATQDHNYFKQALEQVQLGCEVLVKCANQVYKELNDAPLFGETYLGSLTEFKQKAKVYPVTPVSIAQHYVEQKLMPGHANGSDQFKLVYALRGFGDFQISKAPGYEEILRIYNITVPDGAKMNPKYFEEYTKAHIPLLQTLIRLNGPVSTFNDNAHMLNGLFVGGPELDMANMQPLANLSNYHLKPFTVAKAQNVDPPNEPAIAPETIRDDLLSLITNTDVEYERQRFVDLYAKDPTAPPNAIDSREEIQYRNLVETGIVPINVNALQREVPLANLLNYAYTFEKYVIESLGVDLSNEATNEIVSLSYFMPAPMRVARGVKDLMARSLVHPYASIPAANFDAEYKTMLMGTGPVAGKLRFERPKFVSDQIWNKLCVRSMPVDTSAPAPAGIAYVDEKGVQQDIAIPNIAVKQQIGKRRFDTVLVRNLVWTVQLHRFLTWSIKEKTRKVVNPVSQGDDAYDPAAVEFYGTEGVETYPL